MISRYLDMSRKLSSKIHTVLQLHGTLKASGSVSSRDSAYCYNTKQCLQKAKILSTRRSCQISAGLRRTCYHIESPAAVCFRVFSLARGQAELHRTFLDRQINFNQLLFLAFADLFPFEVMGRVTVKVMLFHPRNLVRLHSRSRVALRWQILQLM